MATEAEIKRFIIDAQNQRDCQANVIKNGTDQICSFCDRFDETIHHLVVECKVLDPEK